jgi:hypothetical protein
MLSLLSVRMSMQLLQSVPAGFPAPLRRSRFDVGVAFDRHLLGPLRRIRRRRCRDPSCQLEWQTDTCTRPAMPRHVARLHPHIGLGLLDSWHILFGGLGGQA